MPVFAIGKSQRLAILDATPSADGTLHVAAYAGRDNASMLELANVDADGAATAADLSAVDQVTVQLISPVETLTFAELLASSSAVETSETDGQLIVRWGLLEEIAVGTYKVRILAREGVEDDNLTVLVDPLHPSNRIVLTVA